MPTTPVLPFGVARKLFAARPVVALIVIVPPPVIGTPPTVSQGALEVALMLVTVPEPEIGGLNAVVAGS